MDYLLVMVSFMSLGFHSNDSLIYLGCRRSFCSNHIADHSNDLRNRFEEIINEYNFVNDIFREYKQNSNDFQWKINENQKELNEIKFEIHGNEKISK